MDDFLNFLSQYNFQIPNLTLDGQIHRFSIEGKKDRGWYVGWQNHSVKGNGTYINAVVGDWKFGSKLEYKSNNVKLSKEDKDVMAKQLLEAMKKAEEERRQKQLNASEVAKNKFEYIRSSKLETEYTIKKKIKELGNVKIDVESIIHVPMYDVDGNMWGLQRIYPDGTKKFIFGQKVQECFFTFGTLNDDTEEIYICEGWATGSTIYEFTGKPVVCAFNAGNLKPVAVAIHQKYPVSKIIVLADNDRFSDAENVGVEKARQAAVSCCGTVKIPVFKNDDLKGTDFNDLYIQEGAQSLLKVLNDEEDDENEETGFFPLGYIDHEYFFYACQQRDIVRINSFSNTQMYALAPYDYWESNYLTKKGISWDSAKNHLVSASRRVGPFDRNRCRGTGVWLDEGRVVVNTGQNLIVDGEKTSMRGLKKTSFVYIKTQNSMPPISEDPMPIDESRKLINICNMFKWDDVKSGTLLAGWLAIARIAGALPIRPHVWLTGGAGTGKSTILEHLVCNALGGARAKLYAQGSSTEAGIRQSMKGSSIPVIIDEAETTNPTSKQRIEAIIEMTRQSWSESGGLVLKGSVTGEADIFTLNFPAMLSSIRVGLNNDADRQRFSILELTPHGSDPSHWKRVTEQMSFITEDYGERLFARMIRMIPVIRRNYEVISNHLALKMGKRYGQQTGMILAGYWALDSDKPITDIEAKYLIDDFNPVEDMVNSINDEDECLNHLLTWRFSVASPDGFRTDMTVSEIFAMDKGIKKSDYISYLQNYGLYLYKDTHLFISSTHAELAKVYRGTKWTKWNPNILRVDKMNSNEDDIVKPFVYRPNRGKQMRGVIVPLSKICSVTE